MEPVPTQAEENVNFQIDSFDKEDNESAEDDNNSNDGIDMDDGDDNWDDEVDAETGRRHRKLQSMGIMLGDEFVGGNRGGACCGRYWYLWLCCSVMAVSLVLVLEGAVEYHKKVAMLTGRGENGDDFNAAQCHVYDKETLKMVEQHFAMANDTSTFCQADKLDICTCKHPFFAAKPESHITEWAEIETMNLAMVDKYTKHGTPNPDVVLLGDSITEHWNGLDLGYTNGSWRGIKKVFDHIFNKHLGGKVNGVALGIGGDRIANLLYRLQHGEAPKVFHPLIWWILIGTNDLEDSCNADTITVGNFRIVEEIRRYHPGAVIVLNSILPRDDNPDDLFNSTSWPIIQEINLKLECYANTARGVEFFNATDVFVAHRKGKTVVNQQFMKDPVHPNSEGSRLWGEAIADRVLDIKNKKHHGKQRHET